MSLSVSSSWNLSCGCLTYWMSRRVRKDSLSLLVILFPSCSYLKKYSLREGWGAVQGSRDYLMKCRYHLTQVVIQIPPLKLKSEMGRLCGVGFLVKSVCVRRGTTWTKADKRFPKSASNPGRWCQRQWCPERRGCSLAVADSMLFFYWVVLTNNNTWLAFNFLLL